MTGSCCGPNPRQGQSISYLGINGVQIGIQGLEETLRDVAADLGDAPEEEIKHVLVSRVAEKNHIPGDKEAEYGEALLQKYRQILDTTESGGEQDKRKDGTGLTGKLKGLFSGRGKGSCCGVDIEEIPREESKEQGS